MVCASMCVLFFSSASTVQTYLESSFPRRGYIPQATQQTNSHRCGTGRQHELAPTMHRASASQKKTWKPHYPVPKVSSDFDMSPQCLVQKLWAPLNAKRYTQSDFNKLCKILHIKFSGFCTSVLQKSSARVKKMMYKMAIPFAPL